MHRDTDLQSPRVVWNRWKDSMLVQVQEMDRMARRCSNRDPMPHRTATTTDHYHNSGTVHFIHHNIIHHLLLVHYQPHFTTDPRFNSYRTEAPG